MARAQDDPTQYAFHVDVPDEAERIDEVAQIGGLTRQRQMNISQAQREGFTLVVIAKAFNSSAASQVLALSEQLPQASLPRPRSRKRATMVAGDPAEREAQPRIISQRSNAGRANAPLNYGWPRHNPGLRVEGRDARGAGARLAVSVYRRLCGPGGGRGGEAVDRRPGQGSGLPRRGSGDRLDGRQRRAASSTWWFS